MFYGLGRLVRANAEITGIFTSLFFVPTARLLCGDSGLLNYKDPEEKVPEAHTISTRHITVAAEIYS